MIVQYESAGIHPESDSRQHSTRHSGSKTRTSGRLRAPEAHDSGEGIGNGRGARIFGSNTLNLKKHHTSSVCRLPSSRSSESCAAHDIHDHGRHTCTSLPSARLSGFLPVDASCSPRRNNAEIGPNGISAESEESTVPRRKTIRGAREPLEFPVCSGEAHTIEVIRICRPGFMVLPIPIRRTRSVSQSSWDVFVPLSCRLAASARPPLHGSNVSLVFERETHNAPQEPVLLFLIPLLWTLLQSPLHLPLDGVDVPRTMMPQEYRQDLRRTRLGAYIRRARDPRLHDARHSRPRSFAFAFGEDRRRRKRLEFARLLTRRS